VDTILSGTFIAADKGRSGTHSQRFAGLDAPPSVLSDAQGSSFVLSTQDLGSLDIGSPVYYKRYAVGKVSSYTLKPDGSAITVQVFIDAPYDRLISGDTRFWNAAGLDLSLDANGLKLHAQTLASVISGGIAFSTPADVAATPARQRYVLAQTEEAAMASPAGPSRRYRLRFDHALRGLAVGAPVEFLGRNVGSVQSIDLDYSNAAQRFPIIVDIEVFPARMGNVLEKLPRYEGSEDEIAARFLKSMVDNGLRAQAKSGNLLTGQLYIGLDFVANAPKVKFSATASPLEIPTTNGSFDRLQEQLASIIGKIDDLPLKNMAAHLDSTLVTLNHLATQFDREVLPAATETMRQASMTLAESREVLGKDSRLTSNLNQTLEEIRRASRSVRDLADFLGRHPESVLWGK
jgi:paraquat-inducible protein B